MSNNNVQPACNVSECDSLKHELNTAPETETGYLCDFHKAETDNLTKDMMREALAELGSPEDETERLIEDYYIN